MGITADEIYVSGGVVRGWGGITADELKTAIEGGQTIAQVAEANGKSVQSVIDALVAQASADLTQRITDMVNGVRPAAPAEADGATAGA